MTPPNDHKDRINTVSSFLRSKGSVAIAKKHVDEVRDTLSKEENEITHYKPISSPGTDHEAGLLEMDKELHD